MKRTRHLTAAAALLSIVTTAGAALAQPSHQAEPKPGHRLVWDQAWRRFDAIDYVLTGAVVAGALSAPYLWKAPSDPQWKGGILADDAVRDALVAETNEGRQRASRASDVLDAIAIGQPTLVDGLVIPMADSWNGDVAWRMSVLNAQAIGLTGLLNFTGKRLTARQRPVVPDCEKDPDHDDQCLAGPTTSFPSGHTSSAFAGAGLTCAHHANLPLYGDATADALACVFGLSVATATGALRIVADRHYTSDVVVGAALGFGVGYGLPAGLYYSGESDPGLSGANTFRLAVLPQPQGVSVVGSF